MDNTPWNYTEPPHIEPEDAVIRDVEDLLERIGGDVARGCREALLRHLLEAEARERGLRIALREDCRHPWWECFGPDGSLVAWQCTHEFELETASKDVDPWDYALCVALAALTEKRESESENE